MGKNLYRKRFVGICDVMPAKARKGSTGLWATTVRTPKAAALSIDRWSESGCDRPGEPGLVISVYFTAGKYGGGRGESPSVCKCVI